MGGIRRAWADGTLIYEEGVGAFPSNWTFYPGTDTQPGDPQIGFAPVTPTTIPAFIYTCYLVMNNYDMGAFPRVPNFTFEVYGAGWVNDGRAAADRRGKALCGGWCSCGEPRSHGRAGPADAPGAPGDSAGAPRFWSN